METNSRSSSSERLTGIEWMRGLAAFGVICIHSGLAVHNNTTAEANTLRSLCNFVVPFFLTVSFFFAVRSEMTLTLPWRVWIQKRYSRLLVPFAFWSLVYLGLHIAKLAVHHQSDDIPKLLDNPAGIILSGGTSVALYFIPLLFTGLVLIHLLAPFLKQAPLPALFIIFCLGMVFSPFLLIHFFNITFHGWLMAPLELCLGLLQDSVRCLPLIFMTAIMARSLPSPGRENASALLAAGITFLVAVDLTSLPLSFAEPSLGLGAFLVAWGLSGILIPSPVASVVGLFSFGVYLIHQLFLEIIQVTVPYHGTAGVGGTLLISTATFALSMAVIGAASRCGLVVGRIFGLK